MDFQLGDKIQIEDSSYEVAGVVRYRNTVDDKNWTEYRLLEVGTRREKWLSIDLFYHEYSISEVVRVAPMQGYHQVDAGTEIVTQAWGRVDVESGDRAEFVEYEDESEENIISVETWDDGTEYSVGYYLDENEIRLLAHGSPATYAGGVAASASSSFTKAMIIFFVLVFIMPMLSSISITIGGNVTPSIEKYVKKRTAYTYVTSITGKENQNAQVYKSNYDLDATAKDIINAVDGKTVSVQQNTEDGDNSIAILTKREYCFIYTSEEGDVLLQISSRKYVFTTDQDLYHSNRHAHRYYRRFYHSRGYTSDISKYKKSASSFGGYNDTSIGSGSSDSYNSYSNTVRQTSIDARKSSGGGTSSGK